MLGSPTRAGFTLLEIMIVVAVIGILTVAVALNLGRSSGVSRNTDRQSDLRNLQTAIETYKNELGRYPEACNGPDAWSGEIGTDYECTDGSRDYIVALAPDYIDRLPVDPKLPSGRTDVGYVYRTNTDGTVYKIMAMNTVESDPLLNGSGQNFPAYTHPFKSCDVVARIQPTGVADTRQSTYSLCYQSSIGPTQPGPVIAQCESTYDRFRNSYALWGGFAPLLGTTIPDSNPNLTSQERYALKDTVDVICQ